MAEERHPLEISEEVARAAGVPEDLDATQREPYAIPTTRRRRTSGAIYVGGALLTSLLVVAGLPSGLLVMAILLAVISFWHFVSAWQIDVLDPQALETANGATDFSVGHASAAVGFDSWRARPIWNVLVFSADEPPTQRGLVRVDAVDGHVVEMYAEAITDSV